MIPVNTIDADKLLGYIKEFNARRGYTPSLRMIQDYYGVDHNAANRAVTKLVERGDLARTDRRGVFVIAKTSDPGPGT